MKRLDLEMVRGDTFAFSATFEGLTSDLSAARFTCKNISGTQIFQKTLSSGISKIADGVYTVTVAPNDTNNLAEGLYYYDFEVTAGSEVQTVILGSLNIVKDYS